MVNSLSTFSVDDGAAVLHNRSVSCYFRHLRPVLEAAGIEIKAQNRRRIDEAFHAMMGVPYKHCPETWKALKGRLATEAGRRALAEQLANHAAK